MYKICMRHSVTPALTCPIILLLRELSFQTAKDCFVGRLQDVGALRWQHDDFHPFRLAHLQRLRFVMCAEPIKHQMHLAEEIIGRCDLPDEDALNPKWKYSSLRLVSELTGFKRLHLQK